MNSEALFPNCTSSAFGGAGAVNLKPKAAVWPFDRRPAPFAAQVMKRNERCVRYRLPSWWAMNQPRMTSFRGLLPWKVSYV